MEEEKYFDKKYPKSKHNLRCLGPCYPPNTLVVHPITLEYVTDKKNNFCPVPEWLYTEKETGKSFSLVTDICYKPSINKDDKELEMNIILPFIDFNCEQFLKIYYSIFTFQDVVNWIERNKQQGQFLTRERVMECAFNVFGKDIEYVDDSIVNFYMDVIKVKWLKDIYDAVGKYINIKNEKISLARITKENNKDKEKDKEKNNDKENEDDVIKMNFLVEKFVNHEKVAKFLNKFLVNEKKNFSKIDSINNEIKTQFIQYIKNKIKNTIK